MRTSTIKMMAEAIITSPLVLTYWEISINACVDGGNTFPWPSKNSANLGMIFTTIKTATPLAAITTKVG